MTGLRLLSMVLLAALGLPPFAAGGDDPQNVDYVRDIKPILKKHCVGCHGSEKQKSGLRLDTVAFARRGGDSGAAIEPGKSADSLLIQAITGAEGVTAMPPKDEAPLSKDQIALLKLWIDRGAGAPGEDAATGP